MQKTLKWSVAQQLEWRWWVNYLDQKDKAEYLKWKRGYWQNLLNLMQGHLSIRPDMSLLDAGCGPAGIFLNFSNQQGGMYAIDPLLDQYEEKVKHFDRSDYPAVHFHTMPLEALDWEEKFEVIFCMNCINHVADIELSIDRLFAALKQNGHLVLTIDAHNYAFFKQLFRFLPGDALHPHQYDLEEYRTMMTDRGGTLTFGKCIKKEFFFNHYLFVVQK